MTELSPTATALFDKTFRDAMSAVNDFDEIFSPGGVLEVSIRSAGRDFKSLKANLRALLINCIKDNPSYTLINMHAQTDGNKINLLVTGSSSAEDIISTMREFVKREMELPHHDSGHGWLVGVQLDTLLLHVESTVVSSLNKVIRSCAASVLAYPGVFMVTGGFCIGRMGILTQDPCIWVMSDTDVDIAFPESVDGYKVQLWFGDSSLDVVSGELGSSSCNRQTLYMGSSVAPEIKGELSKLGAPKGTLSCFAHTGSCDALVCQVADGKMDSVYAITCAHVLKPKEIRPAVALPLDSLSGKVVMDGHASGDIYWTEFDHEVDVGATTIDSTSSVAPLLPTNLFRVDLCKLQPDHHYSWDTLHIHAQTLIPTCDFQRPVVLKTVAKPPEKATRVAGYGITTGAHIGICSPYVSFSNRYTNLVLKDDNIVVVEPEDQNLIEQVLVYNVGMGKGDSGMIWVTLDHGCGVGIHQTSTLVSTKVQGKTIRLAIAIAMPLIKCQQRLKKLMPPMSIACMDNVSIWLQSVHVL